MSPTPSRPLNAFLAIWSLQLLLLLSAALLPAVRCCSSISNSVRLTLQSQTVLLEDVGPMNPHGYRPNEFWANDWIYEGLVKYGANGAVLLSLAQSWSITSTSSGQMLITFQLQPNVSFSDGQRWNAAAAVLNFDNVLAYPLVDPVNEIHSWYDLPGMLQSWTAVSEYELRLTLREYYPPRTAGADVHPADPLPLPGRLPLDGQQLPQRMGQRHQHAQ